MSAIERFVGDLLRPFSGRLMLGENGYPLPAGATARFRMRAVGGTTWKVDVALTVDTDGSWSYSPVSGDVSTTGFYNVYVAVVQSGKEEHIKAAQQYRFVPLS